MSFTTLAAELGGCDLRRTQKQLLLVEYDGKYRTGATADPDCGRVHQVIKNTDRVSVPFTVEYPDGFATQPERKELQ